MYPYGTDYSMYGSNFDLGDLGIINKFNFDVESDALNKTLADLKKEQETEEAKKARRKSKWGSVIESLPTIVAAITAKDSGELARSLVTFAQLQQENKERKKQVEEAERNRQQALEIQRREQEARKQEIEGERGYRTSERVAGQEFSRGERIESQGFQLQRDDAGFVRDLTKMGYHNELAKEMEGLSQKYRLEAQRQGFSQNLELQTRLIAKDLAQDMAGYLEPSAAHGLADKIARGVPRDKLNSVEQAAVDYYGKMKVADTDLDRRRAFVGMMGTLNNIEVPIQGATPDPYTGQIPKRGLGLEEILPFIVSDPATAIQQLLGPRDPAKDVSATGENVAQIMDNASAAQVDSFIKGTSPQANVIKTEAARIQLGNDSGRAARFAAAIYQQFGLGSAKAMVNQLPLSPEYKQLMIKVIEESDINKRVEEEVSRNFGAVPGMPF